MELSDQIIASVVDRLLFGGVLVLLGLISARALERFKAREALLSRVRERRLDLVLPVLSKLGYIQSQVLDLATEMESSREKIGIGEEWNLKRQKLAAERGLLTKTENLIQEIGEHQLVLGRKLTSLLLRHSTALLEAQLRLSMSTESWSYREGHNLIGALKFLAIEDLVSRIARIV